MEHLWAPWRRTYFEQPKSDECIFCLMCKKKNDPVDYVLYRGEAVLISLNRFPYNVGHTMIIPYRHLENFEELDSKESAEIFQLSNLSISMLKIVLKPTGFDIGVNIGMATGAGEQHLHFHIVPRWVGDTNFMPILTDTKVLSESLDKVWHELSQEIKKR
jgi:ATP adenylyltransferase